MLSNEGIVNWIQRMLVLGRQGAAAVSDRVDHLQGASQPLGDPSLSSSAAVTSAPDDAVEDTKRKKMILLLMSTLFVALLGATLSKHSAMEVEMEVEAGEQTDAFHKHTPNAKDKDKKSNVHLINLEGYLPKDTVNVYDYMLPGTEDAEPLSAAKGRPYYPILNHFQRRNPNSPYAQTWGYFDFEDPNKKWDGKMRPQPNFAGAPNRDVKNDDFPKDAWQRDADYMGLFLAQAKLLVNRTIEAVYGEYGVGIPSDGSITLTEEQMVNREQFAPFVLKEKVADAAEGSWSTKQSFDGIARRVIHHIMTGDTFKLVLGGHSAAAGHGAGFNQSFIIEAGHVLEPVFAHLGVEFRAYNFAQGGVGTVQQALAGMDLRNKDADWILWDSRMTERPAYLIDFFYRQAIISGNRSPVLQSDTGQVNLNGFHDTAGASIAHHGLGWVPVTMTDEQVKDVPWAAQWLQCGRGATTDCKAHEYTAGCWVEREDFTPAVHQNPVAGGAAAWHPGNRIHKRKGRMIALVILRALEYALEKWDTLAAENGGKFPVPEEEWHVTDYYENIREKTKTLGGCFENNWRIGQARHLEEIHTAENHTEVDDHRQLQDDFWPPRICNLPLQGRTLWGPRNNPMETSLLSIMRKNAMGDIDPGISATSAYMKGPCYNPPDRPAPWTEPDYPEPFAPLVGGSRRLDANGKEELSQEEEPHLLRRVEVDADNERVVGKSDRELSFVDQYEIPVSQNMRGALENYENAATLKGTAAVDEDGKIIDNDAIVPGYGLQVGWGKEGICDGSSHSWCGKTCASDCFMSGAQDNRGKVCFDGLSGWAVFDIRDVKHGFIGARMEPWHGNEETPITAGWTEVNNGGMGNYKKSGRERELHEKYQQRHAEEGTERMRREIEEDILNENDDQRRLGGGQSCGMKGDYTFEWAINGTKTTWNQAEFCNHFTRLNYNIDVIKFMDDESKTGNFELAMRMTNVGRDNVMCISHLYWA